MQINIEYKSPLELIPYANNPRKNDAAVDAVASSIREFGFTVPVVVDGDGVVVAGHTRLKAALKLGMDKVPVITRKDMTPQQVRSFRLVDNKVSELAQWDYEALALELEEIDMDMAQFGFEIEEAQTVIEEDNYEPQLPETPRAKRGEVYRLGRHRLMCGDATDAQDVDLLIEGAKVDLIIADPPYNVDYEGGAGKILNDNQPEAMFEKFLEALFTQSDKHLKPGGAFYIWHADGASGISFREACRAVGWKVRQCLVWNKSGFVLGRQDYQWKHEPCLYGWKDGAAHYFINDRTQSTVTTELQDIDKLKLSEARELLKRLLTEIPTTVFDEDRPLRNEAHPTMKPVRLVARMMQNSSRRGENVLDLVAGSGTTLIAAEQLNRTAYIMDLDPKWVDGIIDRWQKLTGNSAELIKGVD